MKNGFAFAIMALLVVGLCAFPLWGDDLQKARDLEAGGENMKALDHYRLWLDAHLDSPEFLSVLFHASGLANDVSGALSVLDNYQQKISDPVLKAGLAAKTALLLELSGRIPEAQKRYEEAWSTAPSSTTQAYLYRSALLLMELGDFLKSEEQARGIIRTASDLLMKKQGILLLVKVMARTNRATDAIRVGRSVIATTGTEVLDEKILFAVWEAAQISNDKESATWAAALLSERYPQTVEAAMTKPNAMVRPWPLPSTLLQDSSPDTDLPITGATPVPTIVPSPATPAAAVSLATATPAPIATSPSVPIAPTPSTATTRRPSAVQTGSFTMKENAEYMVRDLRNAGFLPIIQEALRGSLRYYKVLIPVPVGSDPQATITALKDRGMEGFLVFD